MAACLLTLLGGGIHLCGATEIAQYGGTKAVWPTMWTALNSLNDGDDIFINSKFDFVGNTSSPGAYVSLDSSYVYVRVRVDVGTVTPNTYSDTIHVLIDRRDYGQEGGLPDYAFSWDTAGDVSNHGLEMTVLGTSSSIWLGVAMDDIDGNSNAKGNRDINGGGRTGDGYVRSIDSQATTAFDTTSFLDFAVSWDYLTSANKGDTELGPGQTWRLALGSVRGSHDSSINRDVAGGASIISNVSTGWSATFNTQEVPEPSSLVVLSAVALSSYVGLRFRRRKKTADQPAAI